MKHIPCRKCIACFKISAKTEMIRIARTETGAVIDLSGKAQGRGCYICKSEECVSIAEKQRKIERSFKGKVPGEIYIQLKELLT